MTEAHRGNMKLPCKPSLGGEFSPSWDRNPLGFFHKKAMNVKGRSLNEGEKPWGVKEFESGISHKNVWKEMKNKNINFPLPSGFHSLR